MGIQVNEAFRTPKRHDQKRTPPCHIIGKIPSLENKENILKTTR
jgi:hypothetical protein